MEFCGMIKSKFFEPRFWSAAGKKWIAKATSQLTQAEIRMAFEREMDGSWYAVIPAWPGPKSALAMVCGADSFLDCLAGDDVGCTQVMLDISILEPEDSAEWGLLKHIRAHLFNDGAFYADDETRHEMWLCGVTEFVFGGMPERIWFRTVA